MYGEAQDETRTRDPFLTMEVLYQLSYLGARADGTRRVHRLRRGEKTTR